MIVEELVNLLNTFDKDLEVLIYCNDCAQEFDTENTKVIQENREVIIYI